MAQMPNALIVNPNTIKASNLAELIEYLRSNHDKVTCATHGIGTTSHLTFQLLQRSSSERFLIVVWQGPRL
jgi:tripartite-type tricarboxylate transporter receptor subunit TctC